MKHLMSLFILLAVIPAWSFEGGVSGGGGNMIAPKAPCSPVDTETAEHMIYRARGVLKDYLLRKKQAFETQSLPAEQMQAFAPVFNANRDVETTIDSTDIRVAHRHSCWNADHQPVDGSTITEDPNSICISAFAIAQKADVSDITPQSAALMLHEFSELVGLSESQAVRAQSAALSDLRGQ